ncbi:MAG: hypothetical protein ABUL58_01040 [Steroidobacter sp.]
MTKQCYLHAVLLLLLSVCTTTQALELHSINTEYVNGEYRLTMTATLSARTDRVETVLRDYAQYHALDSRILDARIIRRISPSQLELFTRIKVCFSFLCRNVDRTETVEERPLELLATVIPERSDAVRGSTRTLLSSDGDRTQVQYSTSIVPRFWVPALFGRSIMLRTLRDASTSMFEHIEKRAQ